MKIILNELFQNETFLGTRIKGEVIKEKIKSYVEEDKIFIDFSGIESITQSFADEAFGTIYRRKYIDFKKIKFENTNTEIKDTILFVLKTSKNIPA